MWTEEMSKPHFSFTKHKGMKKTLKWLEDNTVGEYICENNMVILNNERDAIMFKLSFTHEAPNVQ